MPVCVCVCSSEDDGMEPFEMDSGMSREEKMRKGRFRLGVLTLFRGLQEKTTAHGLPHVHNARGTASPAYCICIHSTTCHYIHILFY